MVVGRKHLFGVVLLPLLCILSLPGPALAESYDTVPRTDIYANRDRRYGHLQYFGFYASALQHWNFTGELAPFTNLTWISSNDSDTVIQRLREAQESGVQAVLSLQPFLFDREYRLRDDYLFTLSELRQRIDFEGLAQHIALLYPVDEPYLHAGNSNASSREQIYRELQQANQDIRSLFPGVPLGVIFNHGELFLESFRIPASYDWIGFDCYQSLWDCDGRPATDYYRRLLAAMSPHQALMAVPQAWVKYNDYEKEWYEPQKQYKKRRKNMVRNLKRRLQHHYEIALSEPRFVAFIPFIWSFEPAPGQPETAGFGADRFDQYFPDGGADFLRLLSRIGDEIKRGEPAYPNLTVSHTEPSGQRPADLYEGEILDISPAGRVSAWSTSLAMPYKSLRMQTVVSIDGEQIYASRLRRSFILDRELRPPELADLPELGVHGYRHQLPRGVRDQMQGIVAEVEVRIFPDRAAATEYETLRRNIRMR